MTPLHAIAILALMAAVLTGLAFRSARAGAAWPYTGCVFGLGFLAALIGALTPMVIL
jgi:hypothetical protein